MSFRAVLLVAGQCRTRVSRTRVSPGRIWADYHPDAPLGPSFCPVCRRVVLRGLGRWWEQ